LWVGSDTDWIGDHEFHRYKLAFFPLTGGVPLADETAQPLPGGIYSGSLSSGSNVLFRVNAGGAELSAADNGPNWAGDDGNPTTSPYHNGGSNTAGWGAGATVDSTVPAGTPNAIFDSERWDPGSKNDGGEMAWAFPVASGTQVNVRLFFANRCGCTSSSTQRVFDVALEGASVLDNFDIVAAVGDQKGTMRQYTVTSDGTININLGHETENPLINGIEIATTAAAPPATVAAEAGVAAARLFTLTTTSSAEGRRAGSRAVIFVRRSPQSCPTDEGITGSWLRRASAASWTPVWLKAR
jgi:hypothetical protein